MSATAAVVAPLLRAITRLHPRIGLGLLRRLPERLWAREALVRLDGVRVAVWTGEEIGRALYFLGDYEREQRELLDALVGPGSVVFDVGANVGVFALPAARAGARVVAFEPSRRARRLLERGVAESGLAGRVTIVAAAASDREGSCTFHEGRQGNWGVGRILADGGPVTERFEVPTTTLDAQAAIHGEPAIVKMDIEGAEWLALKGARGLLHGTAPLVLLLEVHPGEIERAGGTAAALLQDLSRAGLVRHDLRSAGEGARSFHVFARRPLEHPGLRVVTSA